MQNVAEHQGKNGKQMHMLSGPFKLIPNADSKSFWNMNIYNIPQQVLFCKVKTWNENNNQSFLLTNCWLISP